METCPKEEPRFWDSTVPMMAYGERRKWMVGMRLFGLPQQVIPSMLEAEYPTEVEGTRSDGYA